VADSLHDVSGFELTPLRPRTLRGVGKVEPYLLARATTAARRSASAESDLALETDDEEQTP